MPDPYSNFGPKVPTSQLARATVDQVLNYAGGYTFQVDPLVLVNRFLILGTTGGTYYASEPKLTKNALDVILPFVDSPEWGTKIVDLLVDVSLHGRAPRQNPTLFLLAALCASKDRATRVKALECVPRVCRTGTMLFIFARYAEQFRGWGRGLRDAVAKWYTDKPVDQLAYQAVKYRQREGYVHRDMLRLSHPKTTDPVRKQLYDWMCGRKVTNPPEIIAGYELANIPGADIVHMINRFKLPWEALPNTALSKPEVWEAMLPEMGITALIRNLNRLTKLGVISTYGGGKAVERLTNPLELRKGRVHPFTVLMALSTYKAGKGIKGSMTWTPNHKIIDALDEAFYLCFNNIEPTGKRTMIALDVSPSMDGSKIYNSHLSARVGAAAMSMVTVKTEPEYIAMAFAGDIQPIAISPKQRLDDVCAMVSGLKWSRTDCSLPMLWALRNKVSVDTFIIYTDNETWSGNIHPFQALRAYRERYSINAKLIVVGMTATQFTIADPDDADMLDVVGFDTAAPQVMADFSRG